MKTGRSVEELKFDKDLWSKSLAVVDIGFESLEVKHTVEQVADQASSLISDLGGQLGLWVGLSMVSVLEVIYCLGVCCFRAIKINLCGKKIYFSRLFFLS